MNTYHHDISLLNFSLGKCKNFSDGIHVDIEGDTYYIVNGQVHRDDGPALISRNGNTFWYQNGEYHREDGPAVDYIDGEKIWCQHGLIHRDDGPAITYLDQDPEWWANGVQYADIVEWAKALGIYETDEFTMVKLKLGLT